jgi:hypothetical protein
MSALHPIGAAVAGRSERAHDTHRRHEVCTTRDADLEDCVRRKLMQKTGVKAPYLEQLGSFGSAKRDPRGLSGANRPAQLNGLKSRRQAHIFPRPFRLRGSFRLMGRIAPI